MIFNIKNCKYCKLEFEPSTEKNVTCAKCSFLPASTRKKMRAEMRKAVGIKIISEVLHISQDDFDARMNEGKV